MENLTKFLLIIALIFVLGFKFIPTEDIGFSKCSCDKAVYCLTEDQYIKIIMQLSGRGK